MFVGIGKRWELFEVFDRICGLVEDGWGWGGRDEKVCVWVGFVEGVEDGEGK